MNPTFYYEYGKSRIIEILTNLVVMFMVGARWNGYISTKWADLFSPYNANQILKLDPDNKLHLL
jgi:hypothetical protein